MRAIVVRGLSDDLSGTALEHVPVPDPGPGEVLVRVQAAALNYPDLLMTRGSYQVRPDLPFTLGMELAGEVVVTDDGSVYPRGTRVRGGAKTGAFAEWAAIPTALLRPLPQGIGTIEGAAFGAAYHTAYVGLHELGALRAGQSVLVHGASGGVGMAACDLASALGARVIAATHRPEQIEALRRSVRADAVISNNGRFREVVAELTDGRGCDIVFDPVGGDVFDESTRCVAFAGRLLVVGFVSGRIPCIDANIPLIKGFSIVGVRAGEYARRFPDRALHIAEALDRLLGEGRIAPHVGRVLPLQRWRKGLTAMAEGRAVGKTVLAP